MSALVEKSMSELGHLVVAEAAMRAAVTRLERLCPEATRETANLRMQMCEVLAWANATKATLAALRMVGGMGKEEMGKVESRNAEGGSGDCALGTMRPTCNPGALGTTRPTGMLESLHRAGDHSLDEEDANV